MRKLDLIPLSVVFVETIGGGGRGDFDALRLSRPVSSPIDNNILYLTCQRLRVNKCVVVLLPTRRWAQLEKTIGREIKHEPTKERNQAPVTTKRSSAGSRIKVSRKFPLPFFFSLCLSSFSLSLFVTRRARREQVSRNRLSWAVNNMSIELEGKWRKRAFLLLTVSTFHRTCPSLSFGMPEFFSSPPGQSRDRSTPSRLSRRGGFNSRNEIIT